MAQFILIDKATKVYSKPFDADWLINGDYDLEFENGGTLPLNDYKFFKDDFILDKFINIQDDDCHWYYIPKSRKEEFLKMLSEGEADEYEKFNEVFGDYATGGAPVE